MKVQIEKHINDIEMIHNPSSVSSQTLKLAECPNDLIIFIGGTAIPWVSIDGHHTLSAVSQTPQVVTPAELSPYLMWFDVRDCDKNCFIEREKSVQQLPMNYVVCKLWFLLCCCCFLQGIYVTFKFSASATVKVHNW